MKGILTGLLFLASPALAQQAAPAMPSARETAISGMLDECNTGQLNVRTTAINALRQVAELQAQVTKLTDELKAAKVAAAPAKSEAIPSGNSP